MSYRAKKTTGSAEPLNSKSSRISRIAQPIRRASSRQQSLDRASSEDRVNNAPFLTASAAKTPRSASATPLRTPNRPMSISGANVLMTNEKLILQTHATRLTEYLRENEKILGKDLFQRGGLKSMSTKQFIAIFSHLLQNITGTRLSIGTNYVDDIVSVLANIEYPYTVNKSWLKTPNAPHAFNNLLMLFGWMLDFVPKPESIEEFERENIRVDDIMDQEFALKFNASVKLAFALWNNNKHEEFDNLKTEITNGFIENHIELHTTERSLGGLDNVIARLNCEVDELAKTKTMYKEQLSVEEKELKQLEEQTMRKKTRVAKFEKNSKEHQQSIKSLQENNDSKLRQINETKSRIDAIEQLIKSQKMTVNERAEIINDLKYLKHALDSEKNTNTQQQYKYESYQISCSRLMQRTLDSITAFNTYLQQIFADQKDLDGVKIEEISLDRNSQVPLEEQIERVLPLLEKATNSIFQQTKAHTLEMSELEQKLKSLIYEHDNLLEKQLKSIIDKCDEHSKNIENLDAQILNMISRKNIVDITDALKKQVACNAQLEEKISSQNQELAKVIEENKQIMELATEKFEAFLEKWKGNIESFKIDIKDISRKLVEMNLKFKDVGKK